MLKRLAQQMERWDIFIFNQLFKHLNQKSLYLPALFFTRLGDGFLYFIICPIIYFTLLPNPWPCAIITFLAMVIEKISYYLLKKQLKRERPLAKSTSIKQLIEPPDEFSFPSGHTSSAFCMAAMMSHYFPGYGILLFSIAALIGFSRLLLKVHFPLDVIAGSVLGLSTAYIILFLFN